MNSPVETRLRDALLEAGASLDPESLRPLRAGEPARRWMFDLRIIAMGAVAVMVAVAAVAVFLTGGDDDRAPVATVSMAEREVALFLCGKGSVPPPCRGKQVSQEQTAAVAAAVKEMPGVESVVFEDRKTATDDYRRFVVTYPDVKEPVRLEDLPESFRVSLAPGADSATIAAEARKLPGVALALILPAGRPDDLPKGWRPEETVSVFLCGGTQIVRPCTARATPEQTQAVAKALKEQRGVAEIYFVENPMGDLTSRLDRSVAGFGNRFWVRLTPEADREAVLKAAMAMPGVAQALELRCQATPGCS
ncbi:permease-like cell division protein FtsX [Nonomuraea sp. NBC_01738]|uniref:permease-like cell division protein FtsX n=1 Tax=Nonomuraea sp. NBC_01738 TaxID=2976003 RepID=UPI002E0DF686|nr:permease-like cell division protein FtsX [Nonomuraea sp. NBC_01738]